MPTNYRSLARRLQQAIAIKRGRQLSISYYQMFSTKAGRTVTKYVISERIGGKYKSLLESWSLPDVVKFLAGELQKDSPEDMTQEGGAANAR